MYKPYDMVSQFVSSDNVPLLHALDFTFPEGTHAIGRLDRFSEGLLLMTTDKKITRLLFDPLKSHDRIYLVLVKGKVSDARLEDMRQGVEIIIENGQPYLARPKRIEICEAPDFEFSGIDPGKVHGESSWLKITLTEGKYHQVRKMVYAAGHKCLRLIRYSIIDLSIKGLLPGQVHEIPAEEFYEGLRFNSIHP